MTTRSLFSLSVMSALALAACTPSVPDSGAGVGFTDYNSYVRGATQAAPQNGYQAAPMAGTGFDPAAISSAIDTADGRAIPQSGAPYAAPVAAAPLAASAPVATTGQRPRGDAPMGIQSQSGEMAGSHTGISDENDFDAVASRQSIESDAQRIAQNRSQYVVVQPKDLPQRPGSSGPNIVEYALRTTHAPGTQMFNRGGGLFAKDMLKACSKFASADIAQTEFLTRGGPDKDRLGVDPDGDGFACGWDPRPFRTALQ